MIKKVKSLKRNFKPGMQISFNKDVGYALTGVMYQVTAVTEQDLWIAGPQGSTILSTRDLSTVVTKIH